VLEPHVPEDVVKAVLDPERPSNDPVVRTVQLLMSGFGYDFYDARNVARANDLLVRAKARELLAEAARALARLEHAFRDAFVPPATREQPLPPADVLQTLRSTARFVQRIDDTAARIAALETPATDAIWFRVRTESALLERLVAFDVDLVVAANDLAATVAALDVDALHGGRSEPVTQGIARIEHALAERAALLTIPTR